MQEIVKDEKAKILRYAAKVLKQEIRKVNGIETLKFCWSYRKANG